MGRARICAGIVRRRIESDRDQCGTTGASRLGSHGGRRGRTLPALGGDGGAEIGAIRSEWAETGERVLRLSGRQIGRHVADELSRAGA